MGKKKFPKGSGDPKRRVPSEDASSAQQQEQLPVSETSQASDNGRKSQGQKQFSEPKGSQAAKSRSRDQPSASQEPISQYSRLRTQQALPHQFPPQQQFMPLRQLPSQKFGQRFPALQQQQVPSVGLQQFSPRKQMTQPFPVPKIHQLQQEFKQKLGQTSQVEKQPVKGSDSHSDIEIPVVSKHVLAPSHPEGTQTEGKLEGKRRRGKPKESKPAKESISAGALKQDHSTVVAKQITQVPAEKLEEALKVVQKSSALDFIVPQRKKLNSGGTKGRKILIETNHLALQLKNLGTAIHYDVAIDPDKPKKLLRLVMEQFRRKYYNTRYPAFDGNKNLYSSSLLPFDNEIVGEVSIQEDDREKLFKVKIKFAAQVDLTVLSKYFESASRGNIHMVTPQEAIQCIDVVLRNAPSLNLIPVGRSFFTKPRDRLMDLREGMEMYYGFYQSAILGWKPFLNVDVSHKAFPKNMAVLDLILELCGDRYQIQEPLQRKNFETVEKFLRNLKITYQIPNQPATRRVMRINGLDKPADQARFRNENNVEMSVADYFERVKRVRLRYPHLPCLWVGSKQRQPKILLPAEYCTIMEGQVTNKSMTPGQTSAMIRIAATSTEDRKHKIMNGIRQANFSKDPCAGEFKISVNEEFTKIQARVLDPPKLKYSDRCVTPQRGVWRANKFAQTCTLSNWCIVCLDERTRTQTIQEFAGTLIREGGPLGMVIENPEILPNFRLMLGREKIKLEEEFGKLKKKSLILVVIPEYPRDIYNYVKQAAELTVGVVTQCVKAKNVFQKKQSTLGNILLKINAKLNGRNHRLDPVPVCLQKPCMIMGADVTHPSPESRGSVPSVAAVTASHDNWAFQYNIAWRLQPSTQEIITDLANIVKEHLYYFEQKNNRKPERIIFFRDGVSEGQFEIVVQSEVQAVRKACSMVDPTGAYKPIITFLVVQKRHHTRFFPTNQRDSEDRNFNVPAGTIVDTEITHPTALDFYLVSHASIQGVARPTKYRKLWDDDDMQEDELEELTYHLCHLFTRCTRSVSYPAPTYYAHLAAARAKVYCERRPINMNNLEREQAQLQIKEEISRGFPMFFV